MEKNNKLPVIDIKGSDYVLVKDRVIELHRQNDDFSLTTEIISDDDTRVVMKTTIEIEERIFTGIASEFKSKECCYENCETSSVGRAIGFYGIGIVESIASADEMNKFHGSSINQPPKPASKKQIYLIEKMCDEVGAAYGEYITNDMTMKEAGEVISKLDGVKQELAAESPLEQKEDGDLRKQPEEEQDNEKLPF